MKPWDILSQTMGLQQISLANLIEAVITAHKKINISVDFQSIKILTNFFVSILPLFFVRQVPRCLVKLLVLLNVKPQNSHSFGFGAKLEENQWTIATIIKSVHFCISVEKEYLWHFTWFSLRRFRWLLCWRLFLNNI